MSPTYKNPKNNRCLNILTGMCILLTSPSAFIEDKIISCSESKKSFHASLDYLSKQDLELAYHEFLKSLSQIEKSDEPKLSSQEEEIFQEALSLYLKEGLNAPEETAKKLITQYSDHSNPHMELLLALAHANLGQFTQFFERFYNAYPYLHDHFLTYKTLAVISFRQMQYSNIESVRSEFKEKGIKFLYKALEKNSYDPAIYKKLVVLAKEKGDEQLLLSYLEKMVDCEVEIARADIVFYVHAALSLERKDLAQKMLEIVKKEYIYSRAVIAAETMCEEWKK